NNVPTDQDSKTLTQPIEEESKVAEGTFVHTLFAIFILSFLCLCHFFVHMKIGVIVSEPIQK
ncbi:hypothetical protein A2U01_0063153, partial [Trifolium medium]|nr:hypothetical protein [Trifolium medium]